MEHYDLRSSFLPDFYGLHVRVYQFRELLRQQLPELSTHLDDLQVDPVYVSQWFLSFFAVTCPLPMLFRIYDVIFAEGASETLMRVALSLMHKNQARLLACTELEDVMQLLLSRGIWDCYHYNADELVSDFVSFSEVVTRERLQALEVSFREAQIASNLNSTSANAARTSEVTTAAASRFLGRLWTSSSSTATATSTSSSTTRTITSGGGTSPTLSTPRTANNLSPGLNPPRPLSMLRRSASKQSLASTLNSMEAGSAVSLFSSASNTTDATSVTRDSSNTSDDFSSTNPATYNGVAGNATKTAGSAGGRAADDRYLHSQIEDLLTALSELQRNHAALASQLQREREEREEDRRAVLAFVDAVRAPKPKPRGVTLITSNGTPANTPTQPPDLSKLLDAVEQRFGEHNANAARRSSMMQTREQLKEELSRAKEQLSIELSKNQDFGRRVYEAEQEVTQLREQLRESHTHVRTLHGEKQRLEKQIHDLRARASAVETIPEAGGGGIVGGGSDWLSSVATAASAALAGQIKGSSSSNGGLRELRLGRSKSTPSQTTPYSRRTSSMLTRNNTDVSLAASTAPPANETEALLLELVQAKTAEALARQEAEECRAKLDALHRQYGLPNSASAESGHQSQPLSATAANAAQAAMGVLGRFTMSITEGAAANNNNGATNGVTSSSTASYKPAVAQQAAGSSVATTASAAAASAAATVSSFWGGWRKG